MESSEEEKDPSHTAAFIKTLASKLWGAIEGKQKQVSTTNTRAVAIATVIKTRRNMVVTARFFALC